jgi:hypothetical protein
VGEGAARRHRGVLRHGCGVIGYGIVEGKFESSEPLWPREREEGKAVWPYRLKIRVEKVFEKPKPRPKGMLVAFAINKLGEEAFKELREYVQVKA